MAQTQESVADAPLHSVMKACLNHFDVLDLVYISCSSKALGQLCQSELSEGNKRLAHTLLKQLVQSAASGPKKGPPPNPIYRNKQGALETTSQARHRKALVWLIEKSSFTLQDQQTSAQGAATVEAVLYTSFIPRPLCEVLVESGCCPGYSQLVAAGRSGVKGLPVWIHAISAVGAPSDIPEYAKELLMSSTARQARPANAADH